MRIAAGTLALWSLALLTSCEKSPHELRLATPFAGVDREIAQELTSFIDGDSRVRITLTESPLDEAAALIALAAGEADIALVSNNLPFRTEIATVMPLYPAVLHIARRADFVRPAGPAFFRNATVFAGLEGSASRIMFEQIAERTGLREGDFRYSKDPDQDNPDVVVLFAPISPQRMAEFPDLVLASFGEPEGIGLGGIIDSAVMLNPHFRPFVIPVGTYGEATPRPIVTLAVDKMLVVRADVDSSVVYDLINEILRLRPAMAAKRPGLFQNLSEDFDVSRSRFVLHAGTQDYLQRDAPSYMERYSGIAEVVATLVVGFGGALIAGVRILARRRKNRIDSFYSKARELRRSVSASSSAQEKQRVIDDVRKLQSEAFDMLIDEKLAADESFRIFITLSNDILQQLGVTDAARRLSDA